MSIGVCSVSTTRKSKPAQPIASAVEGAPLASQQPTGVLPDAIARLKWLTGRSIRGLLNKGLIKQAQRVAADSTAYAAPRHAAQLRHGGQTHGCGFPRLLPKPRGPTAFVSGGGSGIGAVIVRRLAKQGCKVAFRDVADAPSQTLVAEPCAATVRYDRCDVRDVGALRRCWPRRAGAWGPVTVLVNNAARDDRHTIEERDDGILG